MSFNVKSSQIIPVGRFNVQQDTILKDNQEHPYSFIIMKDGVCILPIFRDQVVAIKQYRHTIKRWIWEFPAGIVDEGETPVQTAIRELEEETGYITDKLIPLGSFYPSVGSTTEKIHLFAAECSTKTTCNLDKTELISTELIKFYEMRKIIKSGEFVMGAGLLAWYKYLDYCNS